jgi:cysteine-rich repeat protein
MIVVLLVLSGCGRVGFEYPETSLDSAPPDAPDGGGMDAATIPRPPPPVCGDGTVNAGEQCDDGNGTSSDGCENDCTFSCEAAADCDDSAICNGVESCSSESHACLPGSMATDGTICGEGSCRGGECAPSGCGNTVVEAGEDCDDGNLDPDDGCDNDCTFTCTTDDDCDDGEGCTVELCTASNTCMIRAALVNGSVCERDGNPETRDICLSSTCVPSRCGDGYVDTEAAYPEDCDDANEVSGDGCEIDCSFSCETDAQCMDESICNGVETCDEATHICSPGTPAEDGTTCFDGLCASGVCAPAGDAGVVDAGFPTCETDADCDSGARCCPQCPGDPGLCIRIRLPCPMDISCS